MQPLSYAPGDVVLVKGRGKREQIIDGFSEGEYSTINQAWYSFEDINFVRRADKESMKKLEESWEGEE